MRRRDHVFIGFLLVLLILGIGVSVYGYVQTTRYFDAAQTYSGTQFKGTMLGWSNAEGVANHKSVPVVKDVSFALSFGLLSKSVNISISFEYLYSQNHTFALILPIQLSRLGDPGLTPSPGLFGNVTRPASFNLTETSSVIEFTFQANSNSTSWRTQSISVKAVAAGDLLSGRRGEYEFYLPIGITPPQSVLTDADRHVPYNGTGFFSKADGYNSTVVVDLSKNSEIVQTVPSPSGQGELSIGSPIEALSWNFSASTPPTSILVDYTDPAVVADFEWYLFSGGIWIGVGISVAAATALEIGRFLYDLTDGKFGSPQDE